MTRAVVKKKKKNSVPLRLGLAILTVILVCAIIFIAYSFTRSDANQTYLNQLGACTSKVDQGNIHIGEIADKLKSLNVQDTSTLHSLQDAIDNEIKILDKALLQATALAAPGKLKTSYQSLINGIRSNRYIYTQTNLILKNTRSARLSAAMEDLKGYIDNTARCYAAAKLKKASLTLPASVVSLPEQLNAYALKKRSFYESKARTQQLYVGYFNSMDGILKQFSTTKTDLNINLDQIDAGTLSIEDVYIKIENKLSELATLQTKYEALSPPPKAAELHTAFNSILDTYTNYCQDFKTALSKFEEAQGNDAETAAAKNTFIDLKNKYSALSVTYTDYINNYNSTKFSNESSSSDN